MPNLTFTFDTGNITLTRINDGLAQAWGYQATIDGQPNPETKAQFNRRQMKRIIIDVVKSAEQQAARAQAESAVTDITLT